MRSNEPGDCILQGEGNNDGSCNGFEENTDLFVKQNFKPPSSSNPKKPECYDWNNKIWEGTWPDPKSPAFTECGRTTCIKCKKDCKPEFCASKKCCKNRKDMCCKDFAQYFGHIFGSLMVFMLLLIEME